MSVKVNGLTLKDARKVAELGEELMDVLGVDQISIADNQSNAWTQGRATFPLVWLERVAEEA